MKNEEKNSLDIASLFTSPITKKLNTFDITLTFLPELEREILVLFIVKRSNLTAKHIERIIQSAYLFNVTDQVIKEELRRGYKINKLLFKDAPLFSEFVYYFYAVARHPSEKTYYGIEPPKDTEIPEEDTHLENLTRFFMADENTSAEIKRLKLITEANKIKGHIIPSNTKINSILSDLTTQGYIKYFNKASKTLFYINPDFLNLWLEYHKQLIEEIEQKEKELGSKAEAIKYIIQKYGSVVSQFFLLNIDNLNKDELLHILRYKDEIAMYTPY